MGPNPTLGPAPQYPERNPQFYENKYSAAYPGGRGPLRFEEGVATDTDVPNDFMVGVQQGYITSPGRMNHNAKVDTKWPIETVQQRAHVGSAAWVEAPTFLGNFAGGASSGGVNEFVLEYRDGGRYHRINPALIDD